MNAALGTRLVFFPDFFADFLAVRFFPADFFLEELFFFVAIASPGDLNGAANEVTPVRVWPQDRAANPMRKREKNAFYERRSFIIRTSYGSGESSSSAIS
jgi:hypothetical protein